MFGRQRVRSGSAFHKAEPSRLGQLGLFAQAGVADEPH